MNTKQTIKTAVALLSPMLLFVVLPIPYSYANSAFFVKWFGCGCPKFDAAGNMISPDFNANHFTMIFWAVVSVCAAVLAFFLSKKVIKGKPWLRALYVVAVLAVSCLISFVLYKHMMWN